MFALMFAPQGSAPRQSEALALVCHRLFVIHLCWICCGGTSCVSICQGRDTVGMEVLLVVLLVKVHLPRFHIRTSPDGNDSLPSPAPVCSPPFFSGKYKILGIRRSFQGFIGSIRFSIRGRSRLLDLENPSHKELGITLLVNISPRLKCKLNLLSMDKL